MIDLSPSFFRVDEAVCILPTLIPRYSSVLTTLCCTWLVQVTYRAWANVLAFQMATMNSMGPFREECHIQTQVSGRHASPNTVTMHRLMVTAVLTGCERWTVLTSCERTCTDRWRKNDCIKFTEDEKRTVLADNNFF